MKTKSIIEKKITALENQSLKIMGPVKAIKIDAAISALKWVLKEGN